MRSIDGFMLYKKKRFFFLVFSFVQWAFFFFVMCNRNAMKRKEKCVRKTESVLHFPILSRDNVETMPPIAAPE